MAKFLEHLEKILLYGAILGIPLIVLPFFPNPYTLPKILLAFAVLLLILLAKIVGSIVKGQLTTGRGSFDLPVIFLALTYLIGTVVRTPSKMEAILFPGITTAFVAGALFYFAINAINGETYKKNLSFFLLSSAGIFALLSVASLAGVANKIPQLPEVFKSAFFNPTGSTSSLIIFLISVTPLGIYYLAKDTNYIKKLLAALFLTLILIALTSNILSLLPGKPDSPQTLGIENSWVIAVDTLKENPIWGAGPANFLSSTGRFRPLSYNQLAIWNVRFNSSQNFYLNHLTETGLIGLSVVVILLFSIYKYIKVTQSSPSLSFESLSLLSLLLLLVAFAIFPADILSIFLLFIYLALAGKSKSVHAKFFADSAVSMSERLPVIFISVPIVILLAFGVYLAARGFVAEYKYNQSFQAISKNDAQKTYNLLAEAITLNPYVDRYRASYAQVNLAIANSIAQGATGPGASGSEGHRPGGPQGPEGNLTEEDRNLIAQLVQQAIREGKATVALNPERAQTWEALGRIYQLIMAFAQGADNFAIQSFTQAIRLDPINPNLRIALGGVFYSQGKYDEAIDSFKVAVVAKDNLANAHYNLSAAYREKGEIEKAIEEMKKTLALVSPNSNDYNLAKSELAALEAKRQKPTTESRQPTTESLTPPPPAEEPQLEPPLSLPEEATPPTSQ